jgi:hypothetical protein
MYTSIVGHRRKGETWDASGCISGGASYGCIGDWDRRCRLGLGLLDFILIECAVQNIIEIGHCLRVNRPRCTDTGDEKVEYEHDSHVGIM